MRAFLAIFSLTVLMFGVPGNAVWAATNGLAPIRTNFISEAVLTEAEVDMLVKLAKTKGLGEVAEIETVRASPMGGLWIRVTEPEKVIGRTVTFQTLSVERDGWTRLSKKAKFGNTISNSIGPFWISEWGGPHLQQLTIFTVPKGKIRVKLEAGVSLTTADKIVDAFANGRIDFSNNVRREMVQKLDFSNPVWLSGSRQEHRIAVPNDFEDGHAWIRFAGSDDVFEINLKDERVVILSEIEVRY